MHNLSIYYYYYIFHFIFVFVVNVIGIFSLVIDLDVCLRLFARSIELKDRYIWFDRSHIYLRCDDIPSTIPI